MSSLNWAETGRRIKQLDQDVDRAIEGIDQFLESEEGETACEMLKAASNLELTSDRLLLFSVDGKKTSDLNSTFSFDAFAIGAERFIRHWVSKKDGSTQKKQEISTGDYVLAAVSMAKMRPEAAVNLLYDKLDEFSTRLDGTLDEIGPAVEIRHPSGLLYF